MERNHQRGTSWAPTRRQFLQLAAGGLGAGALATWGVPSLQPLSAAAAARAVALGPACGDVGARSAVFWARADGPGVLCFRLSTSPELRAGRDLVAPASAETGFAASLPVEGLEPASRYYYAAVAGGPGDDPGAVLNWAAERGLLAELRGSFRTAPSEADAGEAIFTWGGDLGANFRPFTIFDAMRRDQPDFHILLGDTIYADQVWTATSLDDYRRKYWETLSDSSLQAFARATPWWAIWDDHEVSDDFDSTFPSMPIGRQAFQEAWPIRRQPDDPTRLYRSFRWGQLAEFFILDTRQYRSPDDVADGPSKTLLGSAQMDWLLAGLQASPARLKFVVSSGPLRYASEDDWSGFRFERDRLLSFVVANGITGLVVLSGDMHYGTAVEHPEGITEVTVGPLAQTPLDNSPVYGQAGVRYTYNAGLTYGRGHVRPTPDGAEVFLSIRDQDGRSLYEIRATG
ncbi:MAG: alkaline phosphatase D family protein [Chloroflexi bacterium]|nr:alkaline phosphatase D family protein [Chloroflexota bacterium]